MKWIFGSLILMTVCSLGFAQNDETIGTLPNKVVVARYTNPDFSPIAVEHGDITIVSQDAQEEYFATTSESVQLTDEWLCGGVVHKVTTWQKTNESPDSHARRHKAAVVANLAVFPPDPPVTGG